MVKALRYLSDGPAIDSLEIFSVVHPTEPCALMSTQSLKVSTRDFSWGKWGRCLWLKNYHPYRAEMSRKSGALTYPKPLGHLGLSRDTFSLITLCITQESLEKHLTSILLFLDHLASCGLIKCLFSVHYGLFRQFTY